MARTDTGSALGKTPTGIPGLDQITGGGLPTGRPTLLTGGPGAGKTMFAVEFIVRGALDHDEPGVFMMFEETAQELAQNVRSLGHDLDKLVAGRKIALDHVYIERSEIEETGDYDLEGLFIRLAHAVDSIGARRVVLDTLEALFSGLSNQALLRAELRRLFRWLKERGLTAVITGERGDTGLTRFGLEEYVADCVIVLDHRSQDQICTRRLRVVKYRGSAHGTNEYPFLIGEHGISVLPITSLKLEHPASEERVSSGSARLDDMLGGGIHRGSSMLVSGSPGTGKSSIGATFAEAACRRGERALLFAYEESAAQLTRNMRSIGIDLERWVKEGLLRIHAVRPTLQGLEQHLLTMYDAVREFRPAAVVVDPISNLGLEHNSPDLKPTLMRLIDFMKSEEVTALFTSLASDGHGNVEWSGVGVSSLMDTWLLVRNLESNGERNRCLYILKSRGTAHSNQVREFVLTSSGIDLVDVYVSDDRVLVGSARVNRETVQRTVDELRRQDHERRRRGIAHRQEAMRARIAALQAALEAEIAAEEFEIAKETFVAESTARGVRSIATLRGAPSQANGSARDEGVGR